MKKSMQTGPIRKRAGRGAALLLAFALLAGLLPASNAYASGEKAAFGSESYSWETGETSAIGIYATSDDVIDSVTCTVEYDSTVIEYGWGGTLTEEGSVAISADGVGSTEYKEFIYFVPIMGCDTSISITDMVITDTDGNTVSADDVSVVVDVAIPESCQLDGISVNGTAIEDFSGTTPRYQLDVDADVEKASVTVTPESASVEVRAQNLDTGTNKVRVYVTGDDGEQARYVLVITRAEEETAAAQDTQEEQEDTADTEVTVIADEEDSADSDGGVLKSFGKAIRNTVAYIGLVFQYHPVLKVVVIIIVVIIVILLLLLFFKRRGKTRKAQADKNRQTRGAGGQEHLDSEENDSFGTDDDGEDAVSAAGEERTAVDAQQEQTAPDPAQPRNEQPDAAAFTLDAAALGEAPQVRRDRLRIAPLPKNADAYGTRTGYDIQEALKSGLLRATDVIEDGRPVIKINHVSMDFKREKDESSSLKETVIRSVKGQREVLKFRALDDISFTVNAGEVVGIVGSNGSGKSTLLKIVSGALLPTEGSVEVDRSKVQLLTLGTGFDKELTGRENVYLNGSLIGYSKEFIDEHYDEIVEFAELGDFMEERVKNYSSGMVSRLGFAIATVRNSPEILILDEVLSVGDMFFKKKSEKRIKEMIHSGSTVLIVSHSTSVIRNNCSKAVWIEKSKLRMVGDPAEVCAAYGKMKA